MVENNLYQLEGNCFGWCVIRWRDLYISIWQVGKSLPSAERKEHTF